MHIVPEAGLWLRPCVGAGLLDPSLQTNTTAPKSHTIISLASFLWDMGKHYRPRSDAAERGVPRIRVSNVCLRNVLLKFE